MKKNSAFCSVLQGHPAVASPKQRIYEQMTSNPAFTERNIQKANAYLLDSRVRSKNLWSRITLCRACTYVFGLSTLWFQQIGSPIICMRSPAVICEQWERNLSFSSADVCGAGMRDAPLRMSAGEASVVQPKIALQSNTKIDQVLAEKAWLQKISMPYTMDGHWKFWRKAGLKLNLNCQRHGGNGGVETWKLPIQRAWIHVFPRRMQLYSSAVCSKHKKVNYTLIVNVSMIANISVQSAYFWFQHKLFVKRSTWNSGYSFHLRMLKTEVIINDLQKRKKKNKIIKTVPASQCK